MVKIRKYEYDYQAGDENGLTINILPNKTV